MEYLKTVGFFLLKAVSNFFIYAVLFGLIFMGITVLKAVFSADFVLGLVVTGIMVVFALYDAIEKTILKMKEKDDVHN